jgi:alcohol dehydrogenase/L-iditol 2-dehydrogenase
LDPLVQKNVTLRGSFSHNWPIWEKVIGLMAQRRLSVRDLIGGVWKLQQWQEAFEAMHQGEIIKAVIQPR